jgi:hypothetical protein
MAEATPVMSPPESVASDSLMKKESNRKNSSHENLKKRRHKLEERDTETKKLNVERNEKDAHMEDASKSLKRPSAEYLNKLASPAKLDTSSQSQ